MAEPEPTTLKKIWLASNDGVVKEVDRAVAECSMLIKDMLGDLGPESNSKDNPIPIVNVKDSILTKVIEWCIRHQNDPPISGDDDNAAQKMTEIDEWDQQFMQVDQEVLFDIILASNYLDIQHLLDIGCKTVADMIKGKSPDELRKTFKIPNDTFEEE